METINFKESNKKLGAPNSMEDNCGSLYVANVGEMLNISCWELDEEDLAQITKTKKLWLGVFSGESQPPVFITTTKPDLYFELMDGKLPIQFESKQENILSKPVKFAENPNWEAIGYIQSYNDETNIAMVDLNPSGIKN